MARIEAFFKLMAEQKASDLHLSTNNPPMLRINGDLVRVDHPPIQNERSQGVVYEMRTMSPPIDFPPAPRELPWPR